MRIEYWKRCLKEKEHEAHVKVRVCEVLLA